MSSIYLVVAVVIFIIFLNKNTTYYKYECILIIFILIGICLEEEFRVWKLINILRYILRINY